MTLSTDILGISVLEVWKARKEGNKKGRRSKYKPGGKLYPDNEKWKKENPGKQFPSDVEVRSHKEDKEIQNKKEQDKKDAARKIEEGKNIQGVEDYPSQSYLTPPSEEETEYQKKQGKSEARAAEKRVKELEEAKIAKMPKKKQQEYRARMHKQMLQDAEDAKEEAHHGTGVADFEKFKKLEEEKKKREAKESMEKTTESFIAGFTAGEDTKEDTKVQTPTPKKIIPTPIDEDDDPFGEHEEKPKEEKEKVEKAEEEENELDKFKRFLEHQKKKKEKYEKKQRLATEGKKIMGESDDEKDDIISDKPPAGMKKPTEYEIKEPTKEIKVLPGMVLPKGGFDKRGWKVALSESEKKRQKEHYQALAARREAARGSGVSEADINLMGTPNEKEHTKPENVNQKKQKQPKKRFLNTLTGEMQDTDPSELSDEEQQKNIAEHKEEKVEKAVGKCTVCNEHKHQAEFENPLAKRFGICDQCFMYRQRDWENVDPDADRENLKRKAEEGPGGMNMGAQRGLGHEAGNIQGSGESTQITEVEEKDKSAYENHEQDESPDSEPNKQQIPPSKVGMDAIKSRVNLIKIKYKNIYKLGNL